MFRRLAVSLCFAWSAAVVGCGDRLCEPSTPDEVRAAAASDADACDKIYVAETDLTSLAGMEAMTEPHRVMISSNSRLTDTSQLTNALSAEVFNNGSLQRLDIGVRNRLLVDQQDLDEIVAALSPVSPRGAAEPEPHQVVIGGQANVARMALSCPDGRCADVDVGWNPPLDAQSFAVDFVLRALQVHGPVVSWEPLRGFGLPRTISFSVEPEPTQFAAYRAWLDEQGFGGTLECCFAGEGCECPP